MAVVQPWDQTEQQSPEHSSAPGEITSTAKPSMAKVALPTGTGSRWVCGFSPQQWGSLSGCGQGVSYMAGQGPQQEEQTQLAPQQGHKNPITRSHMMMQPKGMICSLFGFSFCLDLPDINEMIDIHISTGIKIFDTGPKQLKGFGFQIFSLNHAFKFDENASCFVESQDFTLHVLPNFFAIPTLRKVK